MARWLRSANRLLCNLSWSLQSGAVPPNKSLNRTQIPLRGFVPVSSSVGHHTYRGMLLYTKANVTGMVDDMGRAVEFHTRVLGLPPGIRHGNSYAEILAPGVAIGLHPKRDETSPGSNLSIGSEVSDFDMVVNKLSERSVRFKRQENDTNRFAFFQDLDDTPYVPRSADVWRRLMPNFSLQRTRDLASRLLPQRPSASSAAELGR